MDTKNKIDGFLKEFIQKKDFSPKPDKTINYLEFKSTKAIKFYLDELP